MDRRSWPWKKKSNREAITTKDQDELKTAVNYVQVAQDRYEHMSEMEDQVKILTGKLSNAMEEMAMKDNLVKQHAKVAEEAVSGWEKAEAEALSLKSELESTSVMKLAVEERSVELDAALKESMMQIRNVKEEGEQKLHDVLFAKTKQWEMIKFELQARIDELEQELLKCVAENDALSNSIQEHSDMLMKVGEEKSQADAEIEMLKAGIQAYEKEIVSLKYEVDVVSKELEIRNEEKNMCARSAEVANKQHKEDVKKISKLEAECQKLRGLVRKKLPGPAILAQMKQEVETLERDNGEERLRHSPAKCHSPCGGSSPDFSIESVQQLRKENEILAARLLEMEEETKILKETMLDRNSELQASRNLFVRTANKLQSVETQIQILNQRKCSSGSNVDMKNFNQSELLDDFLEMEKLACVSTESNRSSSVSDKLADVDTRNIAGNLSIGVRSCWRPPMSPASGKRESVQNEIQFSQLQSEIAQAFDSQKRNFNIRKLSLDIKHILQNVLEELPQHSTQDISKEVRSNHDSCDEKQYVGKKSDVAEGLKSSILQIHDFVVSLSKEFIVTQCRPSDIYRHTQKVAEFSSAVDKFLSTESSTDEFLQLLSCVLFRTKEHFKTMFHNMDIRVESNTSLCVDKLTLLEKKVVQHELGRNRFTDSSSNSNKIQEGKSHPSSITRDPLMEQCSPKDFEQLKLENEGLLLNLACLNADLEQKRQQLDALKLQLAACQESNNLAEIQLKCMTESYTSMESCCRDLENEINMLQTKVETLDNELQQERQSHQENLAKYKRQLQQLERRDKNLHLSEVESPFKTNQDKEIAAAAEKLAECQETILLLARQLKIVHPQSGIVDSPLSLKHQTGDGLSEGRRSTSSLNPQAECLATILQRAGDESPTDGDSCRFSPCDTDASSVAISPVSAKHSKHKSSWSYSSNSSKTEAEKHGHRFSRFFSKGK